MSGADDDTGAPDDPADGSDDGTADADAPRTPPGDRGDGSSNRSPVRFVDPRWWVATLRSISWPTPRKTARIARWEVGRTAGTISKRTVLLAVVLGVVGALVGPTLVADGVTLERGIYRVGVEEGSPYAAVVEENPEFVAGEPSREALREGRIDVLVKGRGTLVLHRSTPKGRAAYAAFRSAIQEYNDDLMDEEVAAGGDRAAAYPVEVTLRYDSRLSGGPTGGPGGLPGDDGGNDGGDGDGGGNGGSGGDGGGGGPVQVPSIGGGGSSLAAGGSGSPSDIQPPFPFGSLVLAFLFIVPMNFVIQSYGSTIMDERINRRGELLLVSPVTRADIIGGKTLPYLATLVAVTVGIALLIGGGPLSVAAVVPIAVLFLAAAFVGAMFARSFKELTFVTLAISVFLTAYSFVPAIFTQITPIALISPLTIVVRDLQGVAVAPREFAFSTGPFLLSALVLFALGAGVYREEDMFTQRSVPLKALDAMAAWIRGPWTVGVMSAVFIPFVFVAELLAIALLFALPFQVSLPVLLLSIAGIEEVAKSVHVYAGFEHDRYPRSLGSALAVGTISGLGFFVGEKLTIIVQVVGLPDLFLGRTAFPGAQQLPLALAAVLLLAPLLLHTVTAAISAVGASRGRNAYAVSVCVAALVHLSYNLGVILFVPR